MSFDTHHRRTPAAWAAVIVGIMGLLVTGIAVSWSLHVQNEDQAANLAVHGREFIDRVQTAVEQGLERTRGTAGLVEASVVVTESEFQRYAQKMGPGEGITVIGYVPLVEGSNTLEYSYRREVSGLQFVQGLDLDARVAEFRWRKQPRLEGFVPDDDSDSVLIIGPVFGDARTQVIGLTYTVIDLSYLHRLPGFAALDLSFRESANGVELERDGSYGVWRAGDRVAGRNWEFSLVDREAAASRRTPWVVGGFGVLGTALAVLGLRLRATRRETEVALGELRRSTEEKDRFMASVSHELRTPLTSVVGLASVLEGALDEFEDHEIQKMIGDIHHEGQELSDLVEDLLTVGRDESGVLTYRFAEVDLDAEVAGVVARLARSARLEVAVEDGMGSVHADPLRTRQVIRNLLVNALRHADALVRVEPLDSKDWIGVAVVNDGAGIPEDQASRLFQPYQAGLREGQPGSIGLGLYVSRRLARGMQGDLVYAPRGGMVVFELRLPASPVGDRRNPADLGQGLPDPLEAPLVQSRRR